MTYRLQKAREFLEAARDMGDPAMIAVALRVHRAAWYPSTHRCQPSDMDIFREWRDA